MHDTIFKISMVKGFIGYLICRLYELEIGENLKLKESNGRLSALEEIGPQSRLLFSSDGSRLAAGAKVNSRK
jgi:hypothetical protein